jgi:hypothetical protein
MLAEEAQQVKSVCLTNEAPSYEDLLGSWSIALAFLTSVLEEGECSASPLGLFIPRERPPKTGCIGVCVGPRADLDAVEKRQMYCPCRELNPDSLYLLSHLGSEEAQPKTGIQCFENYVRLSVCSQHRLRRISVRNIEVADMS